MDNQKINIILVGFYDDTLSGVTKNIFKRFNINYANIVYHTKIIPGLEANKIDWVDYEQLDKVNQYPLNHNELIPLDGELISAMSDCERIVLKMMDRLGTFRQLTYQERVNLYYAYLRYWNHIVETHKINLFLSANIPHEVFDYIIYGLCKQKKIPVLFMFHQSQITDTALLMRDWRENNTELKKRYEYLKTHLNKNDAIKISSNFEEHYQSQILRESKAVPFYMKNDIVLKRLIKSTRNFFFRLWINSKRKPFVMIFKLINPLVWLRLIFRIIKQQVVKYDFEISYKMLSINPDLSKPYVYVALQYQPELSTSPLADAFVDQQLIVYMISKHSPKDVLIYVKEHPKQTSFCREKSFYKDLLSTNKVVLVRKETNTFELIKNSIAVATSTGTAGWESLFRGKPVLMFGSYIYQFADGVFNIKTNADCINAMHEIFVNHYKPTLRNIRIFMKAFEDVSISAVIDPDYLAVSQLSASENKKNITTALTNEIAKIINK